MFLLKIETIEKWLSPFLVIWASSFGPPLGYTRQSLNMDTK
jgi:hypothetical protein